MVCRSRITSVVVNVPSEIVLNHSCILPLMGFYKLKIRYLVMIGNEIYTAPVVEVIEVEVEKGFACSQQQEETPWDDM